MKDEAPAMSFFILHPSSFRLAPSSLARSRGGFAADQRLVFLADVFGRLARVDGLPQRHENVGPAADALPDLYLGRRLEPHGDVQLGAAAELDHADALPAVQDVAFAGVEDDPPRDQPDDLLDHRDRPPRVRLGQHDGVALVAFAGLGVRYRVAE